MSSPTKQVYDIRRHIHHVHSNVSATAKNNTDESVTGAGSFNVGDTAEIYTGKWDALSRTAAVQPGKSYEDVTS